jgi:hypothetical protein
MTIKETSIPNHHPNPTCNNLHFEINQEYESNQPNDPNQEYATGLRHCRSVERWHGLLIFWGQQPTRKKQGRKASTLGWITQRNF